MLSFIHNQKVHLVHVNEHGQEPRTETNCLSVMLMRPGSWVLHPHKPVIWRETLTHNYRGETMGGSTLQLW